MAARYFGQRSKPGDNAPLVRIYSCSSLAGAFRFFAGDWWKVIDDPVNKGRGDVLTGDDLTTAASLGTLMELPTQPWALTHKQAAPTQVSGETRPVILIPNSDLAEVGVGSAKGRLGHITRFKIGTVEWWQAETATLAQNGITTRTLTDPSAISFSGPSAEASARKWLSENLKGSGPSGFECAPWWMYEPASIFLFSAPPPTSERASFAWLSEVSAAADDAARSLRREVERKERETALAKQKAEEQARQERELLLKGNTENLSGEDFAKTMQARIRARRKEGSP